jgi:hypothetical protein
VYFDLDSDGFAERTGWVSASDGLLVRDANGNGIIDNGSELFGTSTRNGFEVLRAFDSNGDNQITSADANYGDLRMWRDANGDGVSQASELVTLDSLNIASIGLADMAFSQQTSGVFADNSVLATGRFTYTNGTTRDVAAIGFATDRLNTQYVLPVGFGATNDNCLLSRAG